MIVKIANARRKPVKNPHVKGVPKSFEDFAGSSLSVGLSVVCGLDGLVGGGGGGLVGCGRGVQEVVRLSFDPVVSFTLFVPWSPGCTTSIVMSTKVPLLPVAATTTVDLYVSLMAIGVKSG